jgi:hypothetical protein
MELEKIRPPNYDPIAPSHTGQIQTHKNYGCKGIDSKNKFDSPE